MLEYIELEQYLDADCFSVLPVKDCDFCINTKEVNMVDGL